MLFSRYWLFLFRLIYVRDTKKKQKTTIFTLTSEYVPPPRSNYHRMGLKAFCAINIPLHGTRQTFENFFAFAIPM